VEFYTKSNNIYILSNLWTSFQLLYETRLISPDYKHEKICLSTHVRVIQQSKWFNSSKFFLVQGLESTIRL